MCIFCEITKGNIPSTKVYEDDHVLAFLDIAPCEYGHTLVVPKVHADTLPALPAEELRPVMEAVQKVGRALMEKLPCDGFNVIQNNGECAGQSVKHVHFHVIPRYAEKGNVDGMNFSGSCKYESDGAREALGAKIRI